MCGVAGETGLAVADVALLDVGYDGGDYRGPGLNISFRASVVGGTPRPADDAAEVRLFARKDLPPPEEIAVASHRRLLAQWREGQL